MEHSIVEHIDFAELYQSSLCKGIRGIVLVQSTSEIFASCGYSVIYGWSQEKIRSFGPEFRRIQHVIGDVYKKVSSITTYQNSPAIVSGVSEGQVRLWKVSLDSQQIVAMRKKYLVALTAVCNAGRS
ncbi:MAG: hypothetical protein EZS28_016850 [Streblomastix strix]|uniref:Uncharacterized protein n=1 Tax=Streblomastix strix TaxID=222440 RepID=A0A5J4VZC6_9EUKA|nr:MAG: hypothetical protein EZS28_016850 [Streblomastix strix]